MRFFVGALMWLGVLCLVMVSGEYVLSVLRITQKIEPVTLVICLVVGMVSWSYAMDTLIKELKK